MSSVVGCSSCLVLLQNNMDAKLLNWVFDHCYDAWQALLHAICNTLANGSRPWQIVAEL